MPKIFVAYSRADLSFVKKLVNYLEELGYTVKYDKKHFRGSRSTKGEIYSKIEQSDYFLPVMTGSSMRSVWVRPVETQRALDLQQEGKNIRIMPLLLRKMRGHATFPELTHLNYFDFTGKNHVIAFGKLVQALPDTEYDELFYLQKSLEDEPIENRNMLKVLKRMVARPRKPGRRPNWGAMSAKQFMQEVEEVVDGKDDRDSAYWLLIIYGVLKFKNIDKFWDGKDTYPNSVKYAEVAPRGVELMNELSMQGTPVRLRRRPGQEE